MFNEQEKEEEFSLEREKLAARRLVESFSEESSPAQYAEVRQIARRLVSEIIYPTAESGHGYSSDLQAAIVRCNKHVVCLAIRELLNNPDEIVVLGAAVALLEFDGPDGPHVQKIVVLLRSKDESIRFRTAFRVAFFDTLPPGVIKELTCLMGGVDSRVRVAAAAALSHLPASFRILQRALYGDERFKLLAASALARSGKLTGETLQKLVSELENSPEIRYAIICLLIGNRVKPLAAEPILERLLIDPASEPRLVHAALHLLMEIQSGESFRVTMMAAFHSDDSESQLLAVRHLEKASDLLGHAVDLFESQLTSPSIEERSTAVLALRHIGPPAASGIPRLLELLLDAENETIHELVADSIATIGISSLLDRSDFVEYAVPALIAEARKARNLEPFRRLTAILARFRESAIPPLLEMIRTKDLDAKIALAALVEMGEIAAAEVINSLLSDEDPEIREVAMTILSHMGPNARPAIPKLIDMLVFGPIDIRPDLLRTIKALGPEAKDAVPALVDILLDRDLILSAWADSALLSIGPIAADLLREAYIRLDIAGAARLQLIMDKLGVPTSEAAGLDVIRDEALKISKKLRTFQLFGALCKDRKDNVFSFSEAEDQFGIPRSTAQLHIKEISIFFKNYFLRFEKNVIDIADDDDATAPESRKLFKRPTSKPCTICEPLGWQAWELTNRFLNKYDEGYKSRKSIKKKRVD